jgi:hypothetical protein
MADTTAVASNQALAAFFTPNQNSKLFTSLNKTSEDTSSSSSTDTSSQNFTINAGELGLYDKKQIQQLSNGQIKPQTPDYISQGSQSSGSYSRRTLYVQNGELLVGNGSQKGQFVQNLELQINGQTGVLSPISTSGQFPVNGQYLQDQQYSQAIPPPTNGNQILNGQYATTSKDPVSQQFGYNAQVEVRGDLSGNGPFKVVNADFINGHYVLDVRSMPNSVLNVDNTQVTTNGQSTNNTQALVNGLNSFQGVYHVLNQFTAVGQITLSGQYDDLGNYLVNGTKLVNGSNAVQAQVISGGIQSTQTVFVTGRYGAGGQYLIDTAKSNPVNTLPSKTPTQEQLQKLFTQPTLFSGNIFNAHA